MYLVLVLHATLRGRVLTFVAYFFFFLCDPRGGRWGLSVVIGSISDPLALGGKMLQPFHQLYWFSPGRGMGFWTCNQLSHSCCGGHCKLWFTQLTVVGYMLGSWIV